jgi:cytochrome c oxidase cbb3-type subunit 4
MKEGLSYFTDTYLTTFGLLIFFGFFMCVVFWVSRPKTRLLCDYAEMLPFENGDKYER